MFAILLAALFATISLVAILTLTDAALRSRNAVRLLRGDLALMCGQPRVSVRFAGEAGEAAVLLPLRSLAISARRQVCRQSRAVSPLRVAA